ncbi:ribonuclease III [Aerophototrophica crusticola]|uniref:Ribonuclease 3 n=1 Tax=Aerophototrophica crusticola TaxID=1709002 RepID=A0A858R5L5_9PROT|nr:ribonuclease III [Rhodospirillaceae bacterium B3]
MSSLPPPPDLRLLLERLGHRFADPALLQQALTHTSLGGHDRMAVGHGYERLEFLGDRVLGLTIAEWLLERFPKEAEGALARRLTALVRAETLVKVANTLGLGPHIRVGTSEMDHAGGIKPVILADACEAVIGALYLDGGFEAARRFVRTHWEGYLESATAPPQDVKTALQEWSLARGGKLPSYEVLGRSGPDHEPVFTVRVAVDGFPPVEAEGASKRLAEKAAAAALLQVIKAKKA